jgi:4-amino-4-deoxy-L-arabinose transferase-like glycosyltransferase
MIWLQAGAIKLFGYSVTAVRVPSFLAALATVGLLFGFATSSLRNWRGGVLACAVLITSGGYVQWHVARSGDYDALLILFQTAQLMLFFNYAEHRKPRHWWAFVIAVILAVMTKGVAGLVPLPAIAAYATGTKMLRPLLTSGRFYGGVAVFFHGSRWLLCCA